MGFLSTASTPPVEASATAIELSVIISVRVTEKRRDILDRIDFYKIDTMIPEGVEFIVVDDGSSEADFAGLMDCASERVRVMRTGGKAHEPFSLVRARNLGAQQAFGRFVMFLDVDLLPYPGFYTDILREVRFLEMRTYVNRFLMVPVIYATEMGYEQMLGMDPNDWRSFMISAVNRKDPDLVDKFSSGTSVIVVDRSYYLSRGGQDEDFSGWGFEDYEFNNRLIRRAKMFPLPANWLSTAGNFMTLKSYEGWKACYRLHGDWLATKAIYLFHAPHPIEESYQSRKNHNMKLLLAKMKEDATKPNEPDALPDPLFGSSLVLRRNPFTYDREFAPYLGFVTFAHEDDFESTDALIEYVREGRFSRVVFHNPYVNERVLDLYRWCRSHGQPIIVAERGALPDSVYHDENGFLSDGASYSPEKWERPLSKAEVEATLRYIAEIKDGDKMLEAQGSRGDLVELKEKLKLKRGQRLLLVPFQQPNDTVIRYFSGDTTFQQFHELICNLVGALGEQWLVVYRRHPSERNLAPIPGAIDGSDYNLYDLLELTHSVALINSGVGIYGMMYGKPVYVFGDAWYAFEGLAKAIEDQSVESVARQINAGYDVNFDRIVQFIHFLRFKFYSFGKMDSRRVTTPDGGQITATRGIDYYELNRWSSETRYLVPFEKRIGTNSPMFDRYRGSDTAAKAAQASPHPPVHVVTSPAPVLPVPAELTPLGGAHIVQGRIAWHEGRIAEAAKHFEEWVAQSPEDPDAHRSLTEAYARMGNIGLARKHIAIARKILPDNKNLKARYNFLHAGFLARKLKKNEALFPIKKP